jgi:uncharacterized protein (UPF0210 family)
MKIRSITYFLNPGWPLNELRLRQAGDFVSTARQAFEAGGYQVQTVRLATTPFPQWVASIGQAELVQQAQALEISARELGYDYVSLGPALPHLPESYALIPEVLAETESVFLAGLMTTPGSAPRSVSLQAVQSCGRVIRDAANISPDGFANLRFAALANVPAGAPFFPAAYHDGERPTFALATESADLAVLAFDRASSLQDARRSLMADVEKHARALEQVANALSRQFDLPFGGIDFTLAPFPEPALSFGTAVELVGAPTVGLHGSLAAAAILTDTLDQVDFRRAGFNGLMLPLLEDAILAARAAQGTLTVKDLLLYSTVCGTGLDTVPLPGDTNAEQLGAVLLDLATLSLRLDKPLTARLMPIPGKKAGDATDFDFAYFANSRILALEAEPLGSFLAGAEMISLSQRNRPAWPPAKD